MPRKRAGVAMRASRLLLPCLLAAALTPAHARDGEEAQTGPLADADVVALASRDWPSGAGGRLRVVVTAQGFEHVSSRVVAQWMAQSEASEAAWSIASSRTLVEPGLLAIGAPRLEARGDAVRVELEGVHTYQPDRPVACTFDLLPDGGVRIVRACGD